MMPAGLEVHKVAEVLGERCCSLQGLPDADRRSRPRYPVKSYLVRGSFVEPVEDDGPEDWERVPLADTYWVKKKKKKSSVDSLP
jgi:hypothetical protein